MKKTKEKVHGTLTLHGVDVATEETLRLMITWLREVARCLKKSQKLAGKVSRYSLMK